MEKIRKLRKNFSPFSSLANKNFRLFIFGFFISQLGFQSLTVAINWQIYQLTHSALALGLVGIVSFIPTICFSMIGGVAADRLNRKHLMIITQIAFSLMALTLGLLTWTHLITPTLVYVLVAVQFIITSFYAPVRQSIIPNIVPSSSLLNAISLNTLARQSAIIIGPSIAGFLLAFYGIEMVYFISALALFIMLITFLPIEIPPLAHKTIATFSFKSMFEGISFVKKSQIMKSTILLDFSVNFFGAATSLLPIFAVEILKTDARGLGILYAATSVGGVLSGVILSSFKKVNHQGIIILVSVLLYSFATIGFGLSKSFPLTCLFLVLIGAGDMMSTILRNNIRQLITPDHLRGRMTGINILFAQGGPKLGDAEAGFVAAISSAPFSVVIGGIGSVIATIIIGLTNPQLKKYKGDETGL